MPRSKDIESDIEAHQQAMPPTYSYPLSVKSLFERVFWTTLGCAVGLISLRVFSVGSLWVQLLIIGICLYLYYCYWWRLRNRYFEANASDGLLRITDPSNWWVFALGSEDDPRSLNDSDVETPTRGFWDRVFGCGTIVFTGKGGSRDRKFRNVRNIKHLLQIQAYVKSVPKRQLTVSEDTLATLVGILALLENRDGDTSLILAHLEMIADKLQAILFELQRHSLYPGGILMQPGDVESSPFGAPDIGVPGDDIETAS